MRSRLLLSTTLVGPQNPTSIAAFGAGKQIQAHLLLHLQHYPSIRKCTVINRSSSSLNVQNLRDILEPLFTSVQFNYLAYYSQSSSSTEDDNNVRNVLGDASIIICATPSTRPLFPSCFVRDGTHVILVGSFKPEMREVDQELILRAVPGTISESDHGKVARNMKRLLLVDSYSACQVEAGEIIDAHVCESDMIEIGELCSHQASTRIRNEEPNRQVKDESAKGAITLFKSVGLGVQDVALACAVVKRAEEMGIGTYIKDYDV
ncbi:hypothetical protein APHAL10511_004969 [Amanita phalloides]|nr:hypothetical protein APHAL10511_004969 [Amanita phalloides]